MSAVEMPFYPLDKKPLNFLWLELTNQCNLRCSHCYSDSGPTTYSHDLLGYEDYVRLIDDAYDMGCRSIQFIGGEPTLNKDIDKLIVHASDRGYDFVELFTNLFRLPEDFLSLIKRRNVQVATSLYADTPDLHDKITTVTGSFTRTLGNIKRLVAEGVRLRVGVIAMDENRHAVDQTMAFLKNIGVANVGTDALRQFGRGSASKDHDMSELCGECANGTLCVGPDGVVSPCTMSKAWSVGSVFRESLHEIVRSEALEDTRSAIYEHAVKPRGIVDICAPKTCAPYDSCSPKLGPGPCAPSGCTPCYPKG